MESGDGLESAVRVGASIATSTFRRDPVEQCEVVGEETLRGPGFEEIGAEAEFDVQSIIPLDEL